MWGYSEQITLSEGDRSCEDDADMAEIIVDLLRGGDMSERKAMCGEGKRLSLRGNTYCVHAINYAQSSLYCHSKVSSIGIVLKVNYKW